MNNQPQAEPVAEKTEYELELIHLASFGKDFGDLDMIGRKKLLSKLIKSYPKQCISDLVCNATEDQYKAWADKMGEAIETRDPFAERGAVYVFEDIWMSDYEDKMRADLARVADQQQREMEESRANRTSQAEYVH